MMWWGWGDGSWVSGLLISLVMLVFWGGLIVLIVWAAMRGGFERPSRPRDNAEAIVEERFARGEIDAEELDSRRTALRGRSGTRAA